MSQDFSLINLRILKPADLANNLSQPATVSKTAVIDVRDNDHVGGHIKGSQWVPSDQLGVRLPELLRINKDADRVVFHCMLSQQRGPKAALEYARAKVRDEKRKKKQGNDENDENEDAKVVEGSRVGGQEICVLEGGFENWQSLYREDEKLTENWVKDVWT